MAEATTYPSLSTDKTQLRASIRDMLAEMDRLHRENEQRQERIEFMDKDIGTSLTNIDAILGRLAAG